MLPEDYEERVYAGVLGKTIGVYLGRPFEGWPYEMIQKRLGDIEYYVHEKMNVPLVVTDDDIAGTFTLSVPSQTTIMIRISALKLSVMPGSTI